MLIWSNLCLKGFEEELHEYDVVLGPVRRHPPHPEGPGGGLLGHQGEGDVRLHRLHHAGLRTSLRHLRSLLRTRTRVALISKLESQIIIAGKFAFYLLGHVVYFYFTLLYTHFLHEFYLWIVIVHSI